VSLVPASLADAEDAAVIAATLAVLVSTLQWTASSPWWKDPIGGTVVGKDLALLVILIPTTILLIWPGLISPLAGAVIGLASMVAITIVMVWRSVALYRIQRPWPLPPRDSSKHPVLRRDSGTEDPGR
jgi:hypothetical protein